MARQTSIDAYNRIKEGGFLSGLKLLAYEVLVDCGPMTTGQVMQEIKNRYPEKTHHNLESVRKRFSEMREDGAIKIIDEVTCPVSGFFGSLWDVTDNVPTKKDRSLNPTRKELILAFRKQIEQVILDLNAYGSFTFSSEWMERSEDLMIKSDKYILESQE